MQFAFSAGGLVYKKDPDLKFLLIRTKSLKDKDLWALPKGAIEKGETIEATAVREVEEETGAKVEPGERIHEIQYFFKRDGELTKKKVYFLLMKYVGGEIRPQLTEVEEAAWFTPDEAQNLMSYDNEKVILDKALAAIKSKALI